MIIPRVTQEFFPVVSGPANQVLALASGLEEYRLHSPILTTTPGSDERTQAAGVTVHRFQPLFAAPHLRPSPALQRYLMRQPAELIHVHGWRNPVADGAIAAARRLGIPVIVQAHGIAYGYRYSNDSALVRIPRRLYDIAVRGFVTHAAAAVVASTQAEAGELIEYGFPAERIATIPAGVAKEFFVERPARPNQGASLRLLTVGRLGWRRNVEQIIQALAILRAWGVPAELRVVGPEVLLAAGEPAGYRQSLEDLAQRLGVRAAVSFAGPRHGAALIEEYRAADVFVCTTRYENFGQPIAEAAAVGLPIVATPTGVASELLAGCEAGMLIPFYDTVATASAIRQLHADPALRHRLGAAMQRYAVAEFDWRKIVLRYIDLYAEQIERGKHSVQFAGA